MSLKFRFDANQEYQLEAIDAVVDLFDGQPYNAIDLVFPKGGGFAAVPNALDLGPEDLQTNLREVQERNIPERLRSGKLECIRGKMTTSEDGAEASFYNFSVEMETGTGKTYVYLRTALELHREYGFRKFIIVVPSVAIAEGVLKTLEITQEHLRGLYGNVAYHWCKYDSSNLTQVRQFALSESVEFMVMTLQSFNKATNILLRSMDQLSGETPIHLLQATRPILILDEPQNMESKTSKAALLNPNPPMALRYSATHRYPYNLVYRLTPADAYRYGLVKRIEVTSVVSDPAENRPYIRLQEVRSRKNTLSARVEVDTLTRAGTPSQKVITVKPGDNLQEKTNRPEYGRYTVSEIDYGAEAITFTNGESLTRGTALGVNKEPIFEEQIRETIRTHFEKQAHLRERGIKVLSLFFIDAVANYAEEDGIIRRLFNECFAEEAAKNEYWADFAPEDVQAAYFAEQRRRDGSVDLLDSKTGEAQRDEEAYELIMRKKERLLSFDEPVSFIFSHSALREGWDNPNVFQICTLNESISDMRKRQEIGRGVRLAVDQTGERTFDEQVNVLTVVANEHYEQYVATLQSELEAEGYEFDEQGPPPPERSKEVTVNLREEMIDSEEFVELWEQIKHRTRYHVTIESDRLVEDVGRELAYLDVPEPKIVVSTSGVGIDDTGVTATGLRRQRVRGGIAWGEGPDLVQMLRHHLENTSPPCRLTRSTLREIVTAERVIPQALKNPQAWVVQAAAKIRKHLMEQICRGIKYERTGDWYEMRKIFDAEIKGYESNTLPAKVSLYDRVIFDSNVEHDFAEGLEKRGDVKLYVKLPRGFVVDTPVGKYNPDWAIVIEHEGERRLYLVRETKGEGELRPTEEHKTECGDRHFKELGVNYEVVSSAEDLKLPLDF